MGSAQASRRSRVSQSGQRGRGRGRLICRAVGGVEALEPRRLLANIVVDTAVDESIADNPTTSLREAIAQAALLGSDDVITFDPNVFDAAGSPHTITLLDGALAVPSGGGQITIDGPGASVLTIDADDASRVFEVPAAAKLIVRDLTLTGGSVTDGAGGAILNDGTLTLSGVTVTRNIAKGSNGVDDAGTVARGGAIANS